MSTLSKREVAVVYEFDGFRLDTANAELLHLGAPCRIEPKALQVLRVLIENHGELVERDALLEQVWGRVVVGPGTLTRLIAQLRRILGDDATTPRFIATAHTRGYRWLAVVRRGGGVQSRSCLPQRTTSLIGRAVDLDALRGLIQANRIVTLAGPGGCGKTQLALELGRQIEEQRRGATLWTDLSTAADVRSCSRLVAEAFEVKEQEHRSLDSGIAIAIGDRAVMLILDNCERVAAHVASLVRGLLEQCPMLRILCTSQATLDLPEERVSWLSPLALPAYTWHAEEQPVAALMRSHAVQLLTERAQAILPEFALTLQDAPFVAEICRRLDGIPLALELAAARLKTLSPQQLLGALNDRFALLARRGSAEDARHRSLRGAIEWSCGLLSEAEQRLLDECSVFAGTFSVDALRAVCAAPEDDQGDLLGRLQGLAQKSLINVERAPVENRYRLLDSIQAFARSRLRATQRDVEVNLRHSRYYAGLAQRADAALLGADQIEWLSQLEADWANLTAAFDWAQQRGECAAELAALSSGLRWYLWIRGMHAEALRWFQVPLDLRESHDPSHEARLFNGKAIALFHGVRFQEAAQAVMRAEQIARRSRLAWESAYAVSLQAWVAGSLGQRADMDRLSAEAHAAANACDDEWLRGFALLGRAQYAIFAEDHETALAELGAIKQHFLHGTDRYMCMFAGMQQGLQYLLVDQVDNARRTLSAALTHAYKIGALRGIAGICEATGYISLSNGEPSEAAWLLGAAELGREVTGAPLFPQWNKSHSRAAYSVPDNSISFGRKVGAWVRAKRENELGKFWRPEVPA